MGKGKQIEVTPVGGTGDDSPFFGVSEEKLRDYREGYPDVDDQLRQYLSTNTPGSDDELPDTVCDLADHAVKAWSDHCEAMAGSPRQAHLVTSFFLERAAAMNRASARHQRSLGKELKRTDEELVKCRSELASKDSALKAIKAELSVGLASKTRDMAILSAEREKIEKSFKLVEEHRDELLNLNMEMREVHKEQRTKISELEQKFTSLEESTREKVKDVTPVDDSWTDLHQQTRLAYYFFAFDMIHVHLSGERPIDLLVEQVKRFVENNPLHPNIPLEYLDLSTDYHLDLSRWPNEGQLVSPMQFDADDFTVSPLHDPPVSTILDTMTKDPHPSGGAHESAER